MVRHAVPFHTLYTICSLIIPWLSCMAWSTCFIQRHVECPSFNVTLSSWMLPAFGRISCTEIVQNPARGFHFQSGFLFFWLETSFSLLHQKETSEKAKERKLQLAGEWLIALCSFGKCEWFLEVGRAYWKASCFSWRKLQEAQGYRSPFLSLKVTHPHQLHACPRHMIQLKLEQELWTWQPLSSSKIDPYDEQSREMEGPKICFKSNDHRRWYLKLERVIVFWFF